MQITGISPRNWVLMGFGISIISVVINTFIISYINNRVKEIDSEHSRLSDSLSKQALELNRADIKHDLARMMRYFATGVPDAQKADARNESAYLLNNFFHRNYAAETDVAPVELIKFEIEEMSQEMSNLQKLKDINDRMEKTTDADEMDKLIAEMDSLNTKSEATTDLGRKMQALKKYALTAFEAKSDFDYWLTLLPVLKESKENIITNINTKQARMKELNEKKANLAGWGDIATYIAVSLQLFGLMFVLTKDIVKDTKERRDKAEKAAAKAEEEAKLAEEETRKAQARTRKAKKEAKIAEQEAEEAKEEAEGAIEEAMKIAESAREEAQKQTAEEIDQENKEEKNR